MIETTDQTQLYDVDYPIGGIPRDHPRLEYLDNLVTSMAPDYKLADQKSSRTLPETGRKVKSKTEIIADLVNSLTGEGGHCKKRLKNGTWEIDESYPKTQKAKSMINKRLIKKVEDLTRDNTNNKVPRCKDYDSMSKDNVASVVPNPNESGFPHSNQLFPLAFVRGDDNNNEIMEGLTNKAVNHEVLTRPYGRPTETVAANQLTYSAPISRLNDNDMIATLGEAQSQAARNETCFLRAINSSETSNGIRHPSPRIGQAYQQTMVAPTYSLLPTEGLVIESAPVGPGVESRWTQAEPFGSAAHISCSSFGVSSLREMDYGTYQSLLWSSVRNNRERPSVVLTDYLNFKNDCESAFNQQKCSNYVQTEKVVSVELDRCSGSFDDQSLGSVSMSTSSLAEAPIEDDFEW